MLKTISAEASALGVSVSAVKGKGNRWNGSHWDVHFCESSTISSCKFNTPSGKEILATSNLRTGPGVAGKLTIAAESDSNIAGEESEWTVTFKGVGTGALANTFIYFEPTAVSPSKWSVTNIAGSWVHDATDAKAKLSGPLLAATAPNGGQRIILKVRNPDPYPATSLRSWNVFIGSAATPTSPGALIDANRLINIGKMTAPDSTTATDPPTGTAPPPGTPWVKARLHYTTTPSADVFMRVLYKVMNVGKMDANKIAMQFKTCDGWKADAKTAVLPKGYFATKNSNTDILTKVESLTSVEEWWIAGRELLSDKLYASQHILHTPAQGSCQMKVAAYNTDSSNTNKVGTKIGDAYFVTHYPLSKPLDVFTNKVTLDDKSAKAQTKINISITTKSKYPKDTQFIIFVQDGTVAYDFPNAQSAADQPDIKGVTQITYHNKDSRTIGCWKRVDGTGAYEKCTFNSTTGPVTRVIFVFGKEEVPIGTISFKLDIINPSAGVIEDKVITGLILGMEKSIKRHYAYVDPINYAPSATTGTVLLLSMIVAAVWG
eukprot:Filipodium_phascolosomae@DN1664_c0_g1_i1.p1